jgi:hypothetical protein
MVAESSANAGTASSTDASTEILKMDFMFGTFGKGESNWRLYHAGAPNWDESRPTEVALRWKRFFRMHHAWVLSISS